MEAMEEEEGGESPIESEDILLNDLRNRTQTQCYLAAKKIAAANICIFGIVAMI